MLHRLQTDKCAGCITTETHVLNLYATDSSIAGQSGGKSNTATINTNAFGVEATDTKIHSGTIEIVATDTPKTPVC